MSKSSNPSTTHKRKGDAKEKTSEKSATDNYNNDKPVPPKYGPLPRIPNQRIWTRGIMMLGVFAIIYFSNRDKREVSFARQKDVLEKRAQDVACSDDYKTELEKFPGCVPSRCGRVVTDKLITALEAGQLLRLAERGIALGTHGAAAILDLHSGALSHDNAFVNVYKLEAARDLFKPTDFMLYKVVKAKIQHAVAHHFGIDAGAIYLTHPTFFSRLTSLPPATLHDQYWHPHVDKETYKSFHYTSLLYLNDFGTDFNGGRFVFVDAERNSTIEPKKGRVSIFTSGSENVHYVERVTSGVRYAITVSFSCDVKYAIADPTLQPA